MEYSSPLEVFLKNICINFDLLESTHICKGWVLNLLRIKCAKRYSYSVRFEILQKQQLIGWYDIDYFFSCYIHKKSFRLFTEKTWFMEWFLLFAPRCSYGCIMTYIRSLTVSSVVVMLMLCECDVWKYSAFSFHRVSAICWGSSGWYADK